MDSMDLTLMISDVSPKFVVFTTKPWGFAGVLRLIPNEPSWSAH